MNVRVSERWGAFIESRVRSGRSRSEDEVLDEALSLLRDRDQAEGQAGCVVSPAESMPAWKQVVETMRMVPDEAFDRMPADSSEQLDHYLYGSPKRSNG